MGHGNSFLSVSERYFAVLDIVYARRRHASNGAGRGRGRVRASVHPAQKTAQTFVTHAGALNTNIGTSVLWAVVPFLCIPHKNPPEILSRGWLGRGGICVRSAAASRKTLMQICFVSRAFRHISGLYPPFPFQPMPSEKGSRTGAGVRLRVHHVCRCGIHRIRPTSLSILMSWILWSPWASSTATKMALSARTTRNSCGDGKDDLHRPHRSF